MLIAAEEMACNKGNSLHKTRRRGRSRTVATVGHNTISDLRRQILFYIEKYNTHRCGTTNE